MMIVKRATSRVAPRAAAAAFAACAVSAVLYATPAAAQTVAITNARVHTVAGDVIERGTVVITDGRIAAVGAGIAVPAGARVIDGAGKVVTPGLLDSHTGLGTVEINAAAGTNDAATTDARITAAFRVTDALNPFSTLIPVTRVDGITRAVVVPQASGSLIAGQGVLIDLGATGAMLTIHRDPVGMYAVLGEAGSARSGGSRGAAMLRLREALQDARDYGANRSAFEGGNRREYALSRLDLEALLPVVRGELPLVVAVARASDILAALRLREEYGLRMVLTGVQEGWIVAAQIAAANVPVVLDPSRNVPGFETLGIRHDNAALLDAAGVQVAIASFDSHNSRNIRQKAGIAVAYGLSHAAALRAVTVNPARIWGVSQQYGTLEVGRAADVVVWSGDPFELTTVAEHVFIAGVEMPADTRQRELLRRYRAFR